VFESKSALCRCGRPAARAAFAIGSLAVLRRVAE
jgi:hypothetical protein